MLGRSPRMNIAKTAENTGAAALSGAALDAPIMEMAVKFRVRAKGWCNVASRRYQAKTIGDNSQKSLKLKIMARMTAITAPVATEKKAAAGPGMRWVAMRTKIWFVPNPRAAQKAKIMPSSNTFSPKGLLQPLSYLQSLSCRMISNPVSTARADLRRAIVCTHPSSGAG